MKTKTYENLLNSKCNKTMRNAYTHAYMDSTKSNKKEKKIETFF